MVREGVHGAEPEARPRQVHVSAPAEKREAKATGASIASRMKLGSGNTPRSDAPTNRKSEGDRDMGTDNADGT